MCLARSSIQRFSASPLMHVPEGDTRRYESDEKTHRRAVLQLRTEHDASAFSALSSDILVTDYPRSGWR